MDWPETLPLARYRFEARAEQPLWLPDYAGSLLRGAYGHALRSLSCLTRARHCQHCPLARECGYRQLFDPLPQATQPLTGIGQPPAPYLLEPPAWGRRLLQPGDTLEFSMVLFGPALAELPLIIQTWRKALAHGLTKSRLPLSLTRVYWEEGQQWVYHAQAGAVAAHTPALRLARPEAAPQACHLRLITPLRLQQGGRILPPRALTASLFSRQLVRRLALLGPLLGWQLRREQALELNAMADTLNDRRRLFWRDWGRYSSRQGRAMKLGGATGHWLFEQVSADLYPLLVLGQWLHLGKETVFGLGGYELTADAWLEYPKDGQNSNY